METPREWAQWRESQPKLPGGADERASGYGIMGVPFDSGHVLGLRRWTATSAGRAFTSIWHRDPQGRWHFAESEDCSVSCSRWFAADVDDASGDRIELDWPDDWTLHVRSSTVDWRARLAATPITRMMSAVAANLPESVWRARPMLTTMQLTATAAMGVGRVGLAGRTPNGRRFEAHPLRVWRVADARATIGGESLGTPHPLPVQARAGDFLIPQHGIFAIGRVYLMPAPAGADA